jgi:hypothetical protein
LCLEKKKKKNKILISYSRNRIIVPQKEETIVLTGVRDLRTLRELKPGTIGELHGWRYARPLEKKQLPELLEMARNLNPVECGARALSFFSSESNVLCSGFSTLSCCFMNNISEGFVACDRHFRRLKIKSPQYVALSCTCSLLLEYQWQ